MNDLVTNLKTSYSWLLTSDQTEVTQDNPYYKGIKINPNNPDPIIGKVKSISLLPNRVLLLRVDVWIPPGAKPVFHILWDIKSVDTPNETKSLVFRIGWNEDGKRTMLSIDPTTGLQSMLCDLDG